jgi:hypothetical protein
VKKVVIDGETITAHEPAQVMTRSVIEARAVELENESA